MSDARFATYVKAERVDAALGLVFGWAVVSTEKGEPYFDLQGDHIPDDALLKAAADFMGGDRAQGDGHGLTGGSLTDGQVVFAFPMTAEVAKSFGITCERTGLLVAVKPSAPVLAKFASGEYTGFSIGGARVRDEEVPA